MANYQDKSWLEEKYYDDGLSLVEVADLAGVAERTIRYHMDKHGLDRRGPGQYPTELDKDWLHEQYVENERSCRDIANDIDAGREVVRRNLKRHGIERREFTHYLKNREKGISRFMVNSTGYVYLSCDNVRVAEHQLLAIAEGADPYKIFGNGKGVVHHRNNIPWDNRPDNIKVLTHSEHRAKHWKYKKLQGTHHTIPIQDGSA